MKGKFYLSLVGLTAVAAVAQITIDPFRLRVFDPDANLNSKEKIQIYEDRTRQMAEKFRESNAEQVNAAGMARLASLSNVSPDEVVDDGTRIKFNITTWYEGDFTGVGAIRPVYNSPTEAVHNVSFPSDGFFADGKYYACDYWVGGGIVYQASFLEYDAETGEKLRELPLDSQWYSVFTRGAKNPVDGKLYVLGYSGTKQPYLAVLNPSKGIYYDEWAIPYTASIVSIAFDKNGVLYALTSSGDLCTIDLETGDANPLFRVEEEGVPVIHYHVLTFDYHTGELFWLRTSENWDRVDLRRIDLENKKVEIISELPGYGFTSAWVDSPVAPEDAPNTVSDIKAVFDKNSKSGDIYITAPSTTFGGGNLSGTLNMEIYVDDNKITTLNNVNPGETRTYENYDFGTSGEHRVSAIVSNEKGSGPKGSVITFCGNDIPKAVENINLSVNNNGEFTLTWDAPTAGIHNGYMDKDLMTYRVVRLPDNKEIANNLKVNVITGQLPDDLNRYSFEIFAMCDGMESEGAVSNSAVFGNGYTIPFSATFDDDFFNLCTVFDLDGDGNTWYETFGSASCYTGYHEELHTSDDWMILPAVYLEPGNYLLETVYSGIAGSSDFDITFGNELSPESQTNIIAEIRNLEWQDFTRSQFHDYLTVKEPGKYYIGYHFISKSTADLDYPYATINNIKLSEGPKDNAPGMLNDLKAKSLPDGQLKVEFEFTAPTVDFEGKPLESMESVEIYNEAGRVIGRVESVVPGGHYTYLLERNVVEGYNKFTLYGVNEYGKGHFNDVEVYVGRDIPSNVLNLDYTVQDNKTVSFTWDAPSETGYNGGYVDPANVSYYFCRSEFDYVEPFPDDEARPFTATSYKHTELGNSYGAPQYMYFYGIMPVNNIGAGPISSVGIILGNPYATPFIESLKGGALGSSVWRIDAAKGSGAWSVASATASDEIQPSDNDGGMLTFRDSSGEPALQSIVTPLIELKDMKDPVVMFDLYHNPKDPASNTLTLQVATDGMNYTQVGNPIKINAGDGWKEYKVSLNEYNGTDRLFVGFTGSSPDGNANFAIDNIRVCDNIAHDLAIKEFNVPDVIEMDDNAMFKVTVESKGIELTDGWCVDIYADNVKVSSVEGKPLNLGETVELVTYLRANAANAHKIVEYEARINLESDENDINDSAFGSVEIMGSSLPAPLDLAGNVKGKEIELSWKQPESSSSNMNSDSFEDYESFAITSQGAWTFYDGDRLYPYGIDNVYYPNMDQPRAFMIWDPSSVGFKDPVWQPRAGKKCLIAFTSSSIRVDGGMDYNEQSDEWLISPRVTGGTTVSFYGASVYSQYPERFEFMVSRAGKEPGDFEILGEQEYVTQAGWTKYSYTLPEDATYFAIRYRSYGWEGFAFLIDDIEYYTGFESATLLGYNVYVNGMKENEEPVNALNTTLPFDPDSDWVFGVSALYKEGESEMTILDMPAGVYELVLSGVKVSVENNSLIIDNADGLVISVVDLSGRTLRQITGTGHDVINDLPKGIYVVNIDKEAFKIMVNK